MATDARDEIVDAPPTGEQIHMPSPSLLPILNAVGISIAVIGITISIVMIIVGLLLFFATAIVWIRDARREFQELPLDHHGH